MNVYEGMAQVIAAVSSIGKVSSENVSYKFRSIDDVMNHLHGPLAEAELFLSPRVLEDWQVNMIPGTNNRQQSQALFRICVDVYASDGSMVTLGPGLAQSHDYGDKAVYQAQQNAVKYLLLEAFAIPTEEQDMDAREADPVPEPEPPEPVEPSEADRAFKWVGEEGKIFKAWTAKQRKAAYQIAMTNLAFDALTNMDEAKRIFDHMAGQYQERPIEQLPLEGESTK